MKLVKPHPQIFLFLGDSPSDLGRSFVRIQEYYESPSKLFRRKFFTMEKFKAWYSRYHGTNGKFDYYTAFYGYNIPGDVFQNWATLYAGRETEAEQRLMTLLGPTPEKFYVIGSPADSAETIDHELSHAFWHLFPEYAKEMSRLQENWMLWPIQQYLRENMYIPEVYPDEITSYIMFDDALLHRAGVSTRKFRVLKEWMLKLYSTYKGKHIKI